MCSTRSATVHVLVEHRMHVVSSMLPRNSLSATVAQAITAQVGLLPSRCVQSISGSATSCVVDRTSMYQPDIFIMSPGSDRHALPEGFHSQSLALLSKKSDFEYMLEDIPMDGMAMEELKDLGFDWVCPRGEARGDLYRMSIMGIAHGRPEVRSGGLGPEQGCPGLGL